MKGIAKTFEIGESLAIIINKDIVRSMNLKKGDRVLYDIIEIVD